MKQKQYYGIIQEDGTVIQDNGEVHLLPNRGTNDEGFPEVLIDAEAVGGFGFFKRQSVKPFIGMKCVFVRNGAYTPFNFTIINENQ